MNWIKKYKSFFQLFGIAILFVFLLEALGYLGWGYIKSTHSFGVLQVHKAINSKEADYLQRLIPASYGLYWNNPNFRDRNYGPQYDRNGYRNPERPLNQSVKKILVLGGSTTNSYPYVSDRNKIWTSLLEQKLANRGLSVEVYNAGLPGGSTAELLSNYLFNARYLMPDLIILHTGANDVAPIMYGDRYGYKTDYSNLRSFTGAQLRPGEETLLRYSRFYRVIYAVWLRNGGFFRSYPKVKLKMTPDEALSSVINNSPIAFQKNLEALTTVAKSNNSHVLFMPVNLRSKEGINSWLSENPTKDNYWEAQRKGLEKHKQVMESLTNGKDVLYFELNESLFDDSWFLDAMHLNEYGEEEKAKQLFEYLSQINIIKHLM